MNLAKLSQSVLAIVIASSSFAQVFVPPMDPPETVPVSPDMRQLLQETTEEGANISQFRLVAEDTLGRNDYSQAAQIGEYLHQFYDFEKRKVLLPAYAVAITAGLSTIPDESKIVLLRALGRAAFVFNDVQILPSADLSAVVDTMLSAAKSDSLDLRQEVYYWLLRIARIDQANADRIRKAAEERTTAIYNVGNNPTNHEQNIELGKLEDIISVAGFSKLGLIKDNELPRIENKSVPEAIEIINEARGEIATHLKWKLAGRTGRISHSEIVAILAWELGENEPELISTTLTRYFSTPIEANDESRKLVLDFIVSNLEQDSTTGHPETLLKAMEDVRFPQGLSMDIKRGKIDPVFDSVTTEKIYALVTGLWPQPEYKSRVRVYLMLRKLNDYGQGASEKIAAFARRAEDYERSTSYDNERTKNNVLAILKRLLPSEASQGN